MSSAASMALRRCLLRRIIPGPGVVPAAHGAPAPPAVVSRRFMGTGSPQGDTRRIAETINASRKRIQQSLVEFDRLHEQIGVNFKAMDVILAERKEATKHLDKVNNAAIGVIVAMPVLMILASKYKDNKIFHP